MSQYFNHVAAFLVLPYSSAIAPMTKNPWKKYIFFQSKGKNKYTICTQNINELKQYTLFYKHGGRPILGDLRVQSCLVVA